MLQRIIPFLFVFISMSVYAQTTVTITSDEEYITEDETLNITATLNSVSASDVTVNFTFTGTATSAIDYTTMVGPYTVAGGNGAGSDADQLSAPFGIFLDATGNIYVVDADNDRIQKWAPGATSGTTVAGGNGAGSATNQLSNPSDVFVDATGNIYIADTDNHRVQMWASGALIGSTVAGGNGQGSALNQLDTPKGIYVDASASVYVSDWSNHRVQKWLSGATVGVTVAGGNGRGTSTNQLDYPAGIFVDSSADLYIADWYNHRIQKWASGDLVGTTVAGGNSGGSDADQLNYPYDVFVDASDNIYVADAFNHRIQKWESGAITGTTVAGGHGQGSDVDQFMTPRGVYVDAFARIYVSDQGNNRVQQNQFAPTIIIEAGQISGALEVAGISDGISEGDETIIVDVNSVINATLVEPSQLNLTIVCTAVPFGDPTQSVCNSGVVSDLFANGDNIQWYAAASGGSALSSSLALVDATSYFATQTVDACESLERFEVVVTINSTAAPTGDASQSFIDSATVANLEATGSDIQWYLASSGGSALATSTSLIDGTSYFATQTLTSCESTSRFEVVATIIPYATNTWTGGGGDSDWNNAANWGSGSVPGPADDVVIPNGYFITLSGSGSCHNLTIGAGGGLTVSATLTASGTVVVESDASDSGSLVFTGTGAIENTAKSTQAAATITYERYVKAGQWHLLSAPLDGQNISNLLTDAGNDIVFSNPDYSMKEYSEGSDSWSTLYTSATAGNMVSGKGYAISRATDGIISISGTQNGTINYALEQSANGWNLLGNPYTSAIRAKTGGSDYLLNSTNVDELDPVYAALYVWDGLYVGDGSANNYRTVNNSGGTLNQTHLQAGQGFFVKAKVSAGNFGFNISMQENESAMPFYKNTEEVWPSIELKAKTESAYATTLITYNSDMTKGLDISYDAGLLNSYPDFALYSRLVEDIGYDFMIQALPMDFDELVIPIGLDAESGEVISFSVNINNLPETYNVFIEDKELNLFTNLSSGGEYTVQLSATSKGIGRFFVHTTFKDALGLDGFDIESNYQVFSRADHNQIVIRGEFSSNVVARIFSISGKLIAIASLSQEVESRLPFNEETGVYIIQITDTEKTITRKLSWVK